jgi:hypothetical protein
VAELRDVLDPKPAPGAKPAGSESGRRTLILGAVLAVLVLSLVAFVSPRSAPETPLNSAESAPAAPLQTGTQPKPAAVQAPTAGSVQPGVEYGDYAKEHAIRPSPTEYVSGARRKEGTEVTVRPIQPEDEPPRVQRQAIYAVVAATYAQYSAAAKRAAQLASRSKSLEPRVLPPEGEGKRYFVILGTARSRKEGELLRSLARGQGIPQDTYVTRLQF